MDLTAHQKEMMLHAIDYKARPDNYRNYYNTGDETDPAWEELVDAGYAKRINRGPELGGIFYCLTPDGFEAIGM